MTTFTDKPTLTGERIRLRPITVDDAEAMFADLADEEANRLTGTHHEFSLEQLQAWCGSRADQTDRIDLAIEPLGPDGRIGSWAGEIVASDWDPDNRSCGFRIALSAHARDQGLGSEAIRLLINYLFGSIDQPTVNRIELEVFDFNPRAIAVYRKLGFIEEGRRRQALWWEGAAQDAIVMSVLRSEWQPQDEVAP